MVDDANLGVHGTVVGGAPVDPSFRFLWGTSFSRCFVIGMHSYNSVGGFPSLDISSRNREWNFQ